jgi:uncharacterized membrane protein YsdA (DUF1294 family)
MEVYMSEIIQNPVWMYLILVNVYVFCLMGYDKQQAKKRRWRVPEANLLFFGIIGGGLGGLLARAFFHHKTRKPKFLVCFLIGVVFDGLLLFFI